MYQGEREENIGLNADALREISRLQEDILQTLRNELKKLKEPEVMGASNTSTPTHEIEEDMTPFPSCSAMSLLKPVRVFSPISSNSRKITTELRHVKSKGKKLTTHRSSAKYDYKLRNYPRPWADTPLRRRTISTESLEVHVTPSHFSDFSAASQQTPQTIDTTYRIENQSQNLPQENLVRVESSERWKKSVILNEQSSQMMSTKDPTSGALTKVAFKLESLRQMNRTETQVNYMFEDEGHSKKNSQRTVVFPAPIPAQDSKRIFVPSSRKLYKERNRLVNKESSQLKLFEESDNNNNNNEKLAEKNDKTVEEYKEPLAINLCPPNQSLNPPVEMVCEMIYERRMVTKSIQVTTLIDQSSQTDEIFTSLSSEFELGLFVAELIDELITRACTDIELKLSQIKSRPERIEMSTSPHQKIQDKLVMETNTEACIIFNPHLPVKVDDVEGKLKLRKSVTSLSTKKNIKTPINNNKLRTQTPSLKSNNNNNNRNVNIKKVIAVNQNSKNISTLNKKKILQDTSNVLKSLKTTENNNNSSNSSHKITRNFASSPIPSSEKLRKIENPQKIEMDKSHIIMTMETCQIDSKMNPIIKLTSIKSVENEDQNNNKTSNSLNCQIIPPILQQPVPHLSKCNSSHHHNSSISANKNQINSSPNQLKDEETSPIVERLPSKKNDKRPRKKSRRRRKSEKSSNCSSVLEPIIKDEESVSNLEIKWLSSPAKNYTNHNLFQKESSSHIISPDLTTKSSQQQKYNRDLQSTLKCPQKRNIKMSYHHPPSSTFEELFPFADTILAEASQILPNLHLNNNNLSNNTKNSQRVSQRVSWNNSHLTTSRALPST